MHRARAKHLFLTLPRTCLFLPPPPPAPHQHICPQERSSDEWRCPLLGPWSMLGWANAAPAIAVCWTPSLQSPGAHLGLVTGRASGGEMRYPPSLQCYVHMGHIGEVRVSTGGGGGGGFNRAPKTGGQ